MHTARREGEAPSEPRGGLIAQAIPRLGRSLALPIKRMQRRVPLLTLAVCVLFTAITGCEAYRLRGVVLHGQRPGVLVVDADDERLQVQGVSDAVIELTVDPREMRPKPQPAVVTDALGQFNTPINADGAGLLEYELQLVVTRKGYRNLWEFLPMPGSNKRLVITLAPGAGGPKPAGNIVDDTIRTGEELLNKQ